MTTLCKLAVEDPSDLVGLAERARSIAAALGLDERRCLAVAVATTEGPGAFLAQGGPCAVELRLIDDGPSFLEVVVAAGASFSDVLADEHLALAERAAERFSLTDEADRGSELIMRWRLAPGSLLRDTDALHAVSTGSKGALDSQHALDRALIGLLDELAWNEAQRLTAQQEVADLNRELEATSHGLLALHAELERARAAESRLAAIVRSSDDAMYSFGPDGRILSWNAGAQHLLGYGEAEIVGQPVEVLVPEGSRPEFAAVLARLGAGELAVRYDAWRARQDGSPVEVAVSLAAIRDPESGEHLGVAAVLRDLTEQRRHEAELAAAEASREVFAERDRIARDLHDLVIQRLFASGMMLQAGRAQASKIPALDQRIAGVVDDLDETIRQIRMTIFALGLEQGGSSSMRAQVLDVAAKASAVLGFEPRVDFVGPLDSVVGPEVGESLLAVANEALSNVARHAGASAVDLVVEAGDEVVLTVTDNGRGLANLAARATRLGGRFDVTSPTEGGTRLEWRVPAGAEQRARRGELAD